MKKETLTCPICKRNDAILPLIEIDAMPVFCNVLLPTRQRAMEAPRGDIHLAFCKHCGHVYNLAYDPAKTNYSKHYENSLHYSPKFNMYAQSIAERLVNRYGIKGKTVVEIGCGKGDFLNLLCKLGNNRGFGFDPSYEEDRVLEKDRQRFEVIRDYYTEKYGNRDADLIVCRHVLEHIESPRAFLESIRKTIGNRPGTAVFFEVPNVMYTLKDLGIWDLIYEHCGYFSALSLTHLFESVGFFPVSVQPAFGGQFLSMEAFPRKNERYSIDLQKEEMGELDDHANAFALQYQKRVTEWKDKLDDFKRNGEKVVVWGAGSKGVTFVNVMWDSALIDYLVDINPHKHGLYVPGSGQKVVGPDDLQDIRPNLVITMNPRYLGEIEEIIRNRGLSCKVISV